MIISINPSTLEKNGEVEEVAMGELDQYFMNARKAQKLWREVPINERAKRVAKVNQFIIDQMDEIAILISKEVGKPPYEAFVSEVYIAIDSTFYYYKNIEKFIGQKKKIDLLFYEALKKKSYLTYKPCGVVAVIGPFNYPFSIPFEQIIQSLMAGNAVIFKPSSDTVLVGQKIQDLFNMVEDLPKGLMQTVFGSGSTIGGGMVDRADRVIFTGSSETGKIIMRRAAENLVPVCLELGGKSEMIVLPDANIERAILGARWGCFTNSGQVCSSVKRLYLHEDIKDEFTEKLVKLTKTLKQGDPLQEEIDVGAMVNETQLKKVLNMIEIAKNEGAKVLCGGRRNPKLKGYFLEPTILGNCKNDMRCVQEEIFGPVLPIIPFKEEDEAIKMANKSRFGLTSSIWSENIEKAEKLAMKIDTGTVMINNCVYSFGLAATPWGGVKQSGIGRTHGELGFYEVTNPFHLNIDTSKNPDPWWMPYNKEFVNIMENFKFIAKSLKV